MRILHLSTGLTVLLDIGVWAAIHLFVSLWAVSRPKESFAPKPGALPSRSTPHLFQWVGVRHWKQYLPDAAPWFRSGLRKKDLIRHNKTSLQDFYIETCRAEWAHWVQLAFSPLFFLWNRPSIGVLMVLYGLMMNLPCIVAQRFNRFRVQALIR